MSAVGLRELKNQLSKYVQRVRSGETVLVTDRGEIVAELSPPKKTSKAGDAVTTVDELRRKGLLYGGGPNEASLYPKMPRALKRMKVARLLDEERGSR